jgi:hypothetical protein
MVDALAVCRCDAGNRRAGLAWRFDTLRLSAVLLVCSGLPRTTPDAAPNAAHLPAYAVTNLSAVWHIASWRGHSKIEKTVRYLGIDVEDALALAENTEI